MAVIQDITARKGLQAELAASEARFRGIAEQLPVMIWRFGVDGCYDYFNKTWYDFRGRIASPTADSGFEWAEDIHPDDRQACLDAYCTAFERREPFESTYRLRRHDGQYRWLADRGAPYHDDRGRFLGFLGSCLDITERIELERSLEQQKEMAEESSQAQDPPAGGPLARRPHPPERRRPLRPAPGDGPQRPTPTRRSSSACGRSGNSVGNVLDLLGDLLNLTKIDAGAMPAEPTRFAARAGPGGVHLQHRGPGQGQGPGRPTPSPTAWRTPSIETDRAKLKQILCNLLSNALRYTDEGHIRVYCERTRRPGAHLRRGHRRRHRPGRPGRGSSTSSPPWSSPTARPARGPAWAWPSAGAWPTCSRARSPCRARPGRGSTFTLALPPRPSLTLRRLGRGRRSRPPPPPPNSARS